MVRSALHSSLNKHDLSGLERFVGRSGLLGESDESLQSLVGRHLCTPSNGNRTPTGFNSSSFQLFHGAVRWTTIDVSCTSLHLLTATAHPI